jgi:hypothetical protein
LLPTPAATPQPPQHQPRPAAAVGATAAGDTSTSQGSLLAKRRGADKVPAALTLANNKGNGKARKGGGGSSKGWTREEQELYATTPVPITPGWVPELTPTRRGADLYLNVR